MSLADPCSHDSESSRQVSYQNHLTQAVLLLKLSQLAATVCSDSLETRNILATLWAVIAIITDSLRNIQYASIDSCSSDDVATIQRHSMMLVRLLLPSMRQAVKDSALQASQSIELLHALLLSPFQPVRDSVAHEIIDAGVLMLASSCQCSLSHGCESMLMRPPFCCSLPQISINTNPSS